MMWSHTRGGLGTKSLHDAIFDMLPVHFPEALLSPWSAGDVMYTAIPWDNCSCLPSMELLPTRCALCSNQVECHSAVQDVPWHCCRWISDIESYTPSSKVDYPIIADPKREIAVQ